jgi:hypothetical protein
MQYSHSAFHTLLYIARFGTCIGSMSVQYPFVHGLYRFEGWFRGNGKHACVH